MLKRGQVAKLEWVGVDSGITSYTVYLVGGTLGNAGSRSLGTVTVSSAGSKFFWTVPTDIVSGAGFQLQLSGLYATGGSSPSFSIQ